MIGVRCTITVFFLFVFPFSLFADYSKVGGIGVSKERAPQQGQASSPPLSFAPGRAVTASTVVRTPSQSYPADSSPKGSRTVSPSSHVVKTDVKNENTVQVASVGTASSLMALGTMIPGDITSADADQEKISQLNAGLPKGHDKDSRSLRFLEVANHAQEYSDAGAATVFVGDGLGEVVVSPKAFVLPAENGSGSQDAYKYFAGNIGSKDQKPEYAGSMDNVLLLLSLYPQNATTLADTTSVMSPIGARWAVGTANLIVDIGERRIYLTAEHVVRGAGGEYPRAGSYLDLWQLNKPDVRASPFPQLQMRRVEVDYPSDAAVIFASPYRPYNQIDKLIWERFKDPQYAPVASEALVGQSVRVVPIAAQDPRLGDTVRFFGRSLEVADPAASGRSTFTDSAHFDGKVIRLATERPSNPWTFDSDPLGRSRNIELFYRTNLEVRGGWSGSAAFDKNGRIVGIASHGTVLIFDRSGSARDGGFVKPSAIQDAFLRFIEFKRPQQGQ